MPGTSESLDDGDDAEDDGTEGPQGADLHPRFRPSDEEKARRRRLREVLTEEGFRWEPWQKPEKHMVFGMIRDDGEMQTHVRYYRAGYIKAERELAHRYIEHVVSPRESAHEEIAEILERHGIDDVDVRPKEIPRRHQGPMPPTRTLWKPIAMAAGAVIVGTLMRRKNWTFGLRK